MPGIMRRKVGKGTIMWVSAPLEPTQATHCREVVLALLRSMMHGEVFASNAPEFVELLMWRKDGHTYLGAVNQQSRTPVYPISGIKVQMAGRFGGVHALTQGHGEAKVTLMGDKTELELPTLDVFQMYQLD